MARRSRAERRHYRKKAWDKTYNMIKNIWNYKDEYGFGKNNKELADRLYKNRHSCSCTMCGHFRELMGPPISDLRQPQFLEDEWFECIGCRAAGDCTICEAPKSYPHEECEDIWPDEEMDKYWPI
jgi:hypothetical protein